MKPRQQDLARIEEALALASSLLEPFRSGTFTVDRKAGGDPVTEADRTVNEALRRLLPQDGEGWLSEETADDPRRLECRRVWVVDPLDGTREFVERIPEWCISVGLVEDGRPVAGGICNPSTGQVFLGSVDDGVTLQGRPVRVSHRRRLSGATVVASRTEVGRGKWDHLEGAPFTVRPLGSVAYKLALVAAGLADATWTLVPKHEWDVAAGVALVLGGGGEVWIPNGGLPRFNQPDPRLPGLMAAPRPLGGPLRQLLGSGATS